jgi:hypothetical protein
MARGITETDVHAAADELVAAGERPTVERIRAHLGTGSPNTVTRWLETWWQRLGQRLEAHAVRVDVPHAPEAVSLLASQWWASALASARDIADLALAEDLASLEAGKRQLAQARDALNVENEATRQRLASALHAEQLAQAQAGELQRLVSQLQSQLTETAQLRHAAVLQAKQAQEATRLLQKQFQEQQAAYNREREQSNQHIRAVEDRAHQEVDSCRQELKELRAHLVALNKEHTSREKTLVADLQRINRELAAALSQASSQRARADVMELQLSTLGDLPSAVRAILRREAPQRTKTVVDKLPFGQEPREQTVTRRNARGSRSSKIKDKRELGEKGSN